MVNVKLYIEGGGPGGARATEFRQGWQAFFARCGLQRLPSVVRGESRERTWDRFRTAVEHPEDGEVAVLVVDSETAVAAGHSVWQHLAREGWERPAGVGGEQVFLMVQTMETWLLAGLEAESPWPDLERVEKDKILLALKKAPSNRYVKGGECFRLLGKTDAAKVELKCASAKRLLDGLRELLGIL